MPFQPTRFIGQGFTHEVPERKYPDLHDVHDGLVEHAEHTDGQTINKLFKIKNHLPGGGKYPPPPPPPSSSHVSRRVNFISHSLPSAEGYESSGQY